MIEFTLSRVTVCACGFILLVSTVSVIEGAYDMDQKEMDGETVERIASLLDYFQFAHLDEIRLDGSRILTEGMYVKVRDGFVELHHGERTYVAETCYEGDFTLEFGEAVTVIRRTSRRSS